MCPHSGPGAPGGRRPAAFFLPGLLTQEHVRRPAYPAQWPAAWGFGPPGVALGSGPLAAATSL